MKTYRELRSKIEYRHPINRTGSTLIMVSKIRSLGNLIEDQDNLSEKVDLLSKQISILSFLNGLNIGIDEDDESLISYMNTLTAGVSGFSDD